MIKDECVCKYELWKELLEKYDYEEWYRKDIIKK